MEVVVCVARRGRLFKVRRTEAKRVRASRRGNGGRRRGTVRADDLDGSIGSGIGRRDEKHACMDDKKDRGRKGGRGG